MNLLKNLRIKILEFANDLEKDRNHLLSEENKKLQEEVNFQKSNVDYLLKIIIDSDLDSKRKEFIINQIFEVAR